MRKVIFKQYDVVPDKVISIEKMGYRIHDDNYLFEEDDQLVIEKITYEEKGDLIIDFDHEDYTSPIVIRIQNVYGIDLASESMKNFAKYLIELRDKQLAENS